MSFQELQSLDKEDIKTIDEVWMIVRSIRQMPKLSNQLNVKWVKSLSPSNTLLKDTLRLKHKGSFTQNWFDTVYTPRFIKEMQSDVSQEALSLLKTLDRQGKNIICVCYCADKRKCHRSIVEDMFYGLI